MSSFDSQHGENGNIMQVTIHSIKGG